MSIYTLVTKAQIAYYTRQLRNVKRRIRSNILTTTSTTGVYYRNPYNQQSMQLQKQHSEIVDKIKRLELKLQEQT